MRLLSEDPNATVATVATAAGVTRQTVYAHFPSRDDLLDAVVDRVTEEVVAALDAADLDSRPAVDAVLRMIGVGWDFFERYPIILHVAASTTDARHDPITDRLTAVVRRGRRSGEIDRSMPTRWLVAAVMALGHAAGEQVGSGALSRRAALAALRTSLIRLVGTGTTS